MPNNAFLERFKPQKWSSRAQKLKSYIQLTKSSKRDHIYKLYLSMPEEHNCLILAS